MKLIMKKSISLLFFALLSITTLFSQRGKDGAKIVNSTEVVNSFTTLTNNASIGDFSINVANSTLNTTTLGNLSQGDLIMIYQVQGTSVDDSLIGNINTWSKWFAKWGAIINYNNCGNYQFLQVESVPNINTINFDCALEHNYTASGNVLIIRVPRYSSLTINNGGVLTTTQWNGNSGGVLAAEVDGITTVNTGGLIDVSGLGFRGGQAVNGNQSSVFGGLRYADANTLEGAEKGEGIAGDQVVYDSFNNGGARYCRGAAANAGGGGNAHNAGGGGGANAGDINAWNNGIGNPDISNPNHINAWALDTSFTPTILTSSGGGRGGYSILRNNRNELTTGPNNTLWGGDDRRDNGGLGGRPLDYSTGKIFFGGAGGAGEGDNGDASDGGNGGGLIFLNTYGDITGGGKIIANGEDGEDVDPGSAPIGQLAGVDAAGGAGAGGTIILKTTGNVSVDSLIANGGRGGDQVLIAGFLYGGIDEAEGPGGGGGGGYIAITSGTPNRTANGGMNGETNSPYVSNFRPNGATMGGIGQEAETINAFDITVRDTLICTNTSVTLTATINGTLPAGATVQWYDAEYGGNLLFAGNPFTTPVLSANTTYYVKVCPAPFTIPVTVTIDPCLAPVVNFSASDSTLCVGDCIDFTDLTTGTTPTSWSWHFFGAATTTSSAQNPTNICYNTPGTFNVALAVSDGNNSDSLFIANFITVTAKDTAAFSYADTVFCINDSDPLPTITATTGGTFTINNSGVINNSTGLIDISSSGVGSYTVTYITNGSCPDTATFNLNIFNAADATITHVGPFCENDPSINLTATDPGGNWTGTGITNATNGTFDPTTSGTGNHLITYTISGTCGDMDTMTITVIPKDTAAFSYSSGNYCLTDPNPTPTITGTTGGLFSINNSGVINSSTGEINITGSGIGSYTVTYITNGTCPDTATFNVSIATSTDATITQAGPFCLNDPSVNLSAVSNGGVWTGTGITDTINGTFNPTTAGVGNHIITYTISGSCGDVDTMTITVNPADDASFNYSPTTFCNTDPNPLPTGIVTSGGTFSINNGGTINNTTGEVNLLSSGPGTYIITYTTNGPCPNSDTMSITITNCAIPPVANLSASNTTVCLNDCIDYSDLSSGGTPTTWTWYFEGGTPNTSSQQNPSNICYDTTGVYGVSLVVNNTFGNDSIYMTNYITVDSCNIVSDVLIIPNVFSPNGDGENDLFKPYGTNITSLYMSVYNRWGEKLYQSEHLNSGWDGRTTAGTLCPDGTYFYIIKVNGETYKGTVTMLR